MILDGRVAVVTGAASGIGYALAQRLAEAGMRVVLSDVDEAALHAAAGALRDAGHDTHAVRTDVGSAEDVAALAAATLERHGAVHVLCNNAGVDSGAPFADIPLESWRWVLDVNLWGPIHGCRTFLPIMRRQGGEAHIVNTASLAGLRGAIPTGTPYVASKFALVGLSENLFHELRASDPDIGVSVLCPAFTRTRMPESERSRPPGVPSLLGDPHRAAVVASQAERAAAGTDPLEVADLVLDAIVHRRFYVLPHHDQAIAAVRGRLAWMTGDDPPEVPYGNR